MDHPYRREMGIPRGVGSYVQAAGSAAPELNGSDLAVFRPRSLVPAVATLAVVSLAAAGCAGRVVFSGSGGAPGSAPTSAAAAAAPKAPGPARSGR
jgi:hypothetical protein